MTIIVMILFTGVAMVSGFMVPVSNNNFVGTRKDMALSMGGNNAKFGIFSPAVYFAKFALGDAKLNKVGWWLAVIYIRNICMHDYIFSYKFLYSVLCSY